MFWKLPREVFDIIVSDLTHDDLNALSRVSKNLHAALAATLWTGIHVDLDGSDGPMYGSRLHDGTVMRCAYSFRRSSAATRHASRLTFTCGFDSFRSWKAPCPHGTNATWQPAVRWWDKTAQRCFDTVIVGATWIVESLGENQLDAFSWDVGACVTSELIGALARQHPHLQSLQLATDYKCPGVPEDERRTIDLSPFRHLKRICWNAPGPHYLQALADALQNNRHHLEELDLELQSCSYLEESMADDYGWLDPDILMDTLTTKKHPSSEPAFPSLRVLRLRSATFYFESTRERLYHAVDFGALESLNIGNCHRSELFLAMLTDSPTPVHLKSLEIQTPDHNDAEVGRFVGSFEGLVDLFVAVMASSIPGRRPQDYLWHALSNHRTTLKRLVYHRTLYSRYCSRGNPRNGYPRDCTELAIPGLDLDAQPVDPADNPLSGLDLECLGLSCDLDLLPALLQPFTCKSTLRILHLRQTGSDQYWRGSRALDFSWIGWTCREFDEDGVPIVTDEDNEQDGHFLSMSHSGLQESLTPVFRKLLDWLFGPDGIASLQVVAFGDFAHGRNGIFLHNIFVCRRGDNSSWEPGCRPYEVFDARDKEHKHEWAALVHPHRAFLEACPVAVGSTLSFVTAGGTQSLIRP